jgi:hypothetical protein
LLLVAKELIIILELLVRSTDYINEDILDPDILEPLWQYKQNDDEAPVSFSTQDLISWSFQIARGMNYLASKKVRT